MQENEKFFEAKIKWKLYNLNLTLLSFNLRYLFSSIFYHIFHSTGSDGVEKTHYSIVIEEEGAPRNDKKRFMSCRSAQLDETDESLKLKLMVNGA